MLMTGIYHEHIEEAAFLYDQRNNLLNEPDGDFDYQAEVEERIEAHIDALELGGTNSRTILGGYLDSDDEGEFFVAIYSLMRMNDDEVERVLDLLEVTFKFPFAVVQVFRIINSWLIDERLIKWLSSDDSDLMKIAVTLLGYRKYGKELPVFKQLLSNDDIALQTAALKAITRNDAQCGRNFAYTLLLNGSDDNFLIEACFENLYVQKEAKIFEIARQYCEQSDLFPDIAPIILGLRADPSDLELLFNMIASGKTSRSVFQAIGFTGRVDILKKLANLEMLEKDEELLPYIQEAAYMVLGCEVPEFVDISATTEDEIEGLEVENEDENTVFSLKDTLAATSLENIKVKKYMLGKPFVNNKLHLEFSAIYKKWLYLELSNENSSFAEVEYDDFVCKSQIVMPN